MTPDERDAFHDYALQHGLDSTALANLLIARELQARRLLVLAGRYDASGPLPERAKVVAHTPSAATKSAFTGLAEAAGLKPSRAAAILFRAELHERWLERHVLVNQFDST